MEATCALSAMVEMAQPWWEPDTQDSKTIERTMLGLPGASRLFTRRWFDDAQNAEVLRSAYIVYAVGFNLSTEER